MPKYSASQMSSPWKTLNTKVIYENSWIALKQDDVITPISKPGTYTFLEAKPFVIIVAVEDEQLVMIEQYRYPIKRAVIEFPAGGIEPDETPIAAAKRELREETGYEADQWNYVGPFFELTSISYQPGHLFVARGLRDTTFHSMAEDGISRRLYIEISLLKKIIREGAVVDGLTPAALIKALLYLGRI
jgi:hypothetical protein